MTEPASPLRVAVLDDYHHLAEQYLSDLVQGGGSSSDRNDPNGFSIDLTVFTDTISPRPDPTALMERLKPFEVIITMRERTPFTREVISALAAGGSDSVKQGGDGGRLKVLMTTGMRNLGIDYEACRDMGVVLTGTPGKGLPAGTPPSFNPTVQHTLSLILALASNIPRDNALITSGNWLQATPLNTFLGGKTLGLLGLGRLGKGLGRIAHLAFGMRIIAWSENLTQTKADEAASGVDLPAGTFEAVSKDELFRQSDVLSVLVVLSDRTRGLVKKRELELMKPTSLLVNTARGPIIDEGDLLDHLEQGKIRGAGLDVFDEEPLGAESRWRMTMWGEGGRSEVVTTPHAGYAFEGDVGMGAMWEGLREELGRVGRGEEVKWRLA